MKKALILVAASAMTSTAFASVDTRAVAMPRSDLNIAAQDYLSCATQTVRNAEETVASTPNSGDCAEQREQLRALLAVAGIPEHMSTIEDAVRFYRAAEHTDTPRLGGLAHEESADPAQLSASESPVVFSEGANEAVSGYYYCVTRHARFPRSLEDAKSHCEPERKTLNRLLGHTESASTVLSQIDAILMNRWLRTSAGRVQ